MELDHPQQREGIKELLRAIMTASLGAARQFESLVPGEGKARAQVLNRICAEYLNFHMWSACMRARPRMSREAYHAFSQYAAKGLAVLASGCFTGLFDKQAEAVFVAGMREAFGRYERCGSDAIGGRDPLTGDYPLAALARRVAELAGHAGEADAAMKAMIAGMESVNVAGVNDRVNGIVRAG